MLRSCSRCFGHACLLWALLAAGPALGQRLAASRQPPKATAAPVLPDSLAQRFERAYFLLGRINNTVRRSTDTQALSEDLPAIEDNLVTIRENFEQYGDVVDVKQLQMYRVLLADMQEQLGKWRTTLSQGSQQLAAMQTQLGTVQTLLPPAPPTGPGVPPPTAVGRALARLQAKYATTARLLAARRQAVTGLQTRVSESYIAALELQDQVREQFGHFNRQDRSAALPPLWRPGSIRADDATRDLVRRSYAAQRGLMGYYFTEHWDYWVWMLVLALGFFGWVFRTFRQVRQQVALAPVAGAPAAEPLALPAQRLRYLRPVPVAAALLVVFSLAPFFDLQPPAAYTDLLQLLLLATLTWLGGRSWPRPLFRFWLGVVALFLALAFAYANRAPGLGTRWLMLLLNGGAATLGWLFWRYLRQTKLLAAFVRPVALLYGGLHVLAVLAGAAGRVSLAKLLSTTAGVALTQAVALSAFVRIVTEAFFLQAQQSRLAGGLSGRLNFGQLESALRKGLTVVVGVLWLMLVSTNLNLYNLFYRLIEHALTAPHHLGTTTFTLGGVLLFGGIILLTVQVQKYIGYLFGVTDDEFSADTGRKGSWLVVIRLGIIVGGLLLATVASGLPVDKIAIVLGALGVGIGLGLQNIINNLVSGVILIFERPFQVGDYIEVKGQTGRVKDIGIRASKLTSQAGSEIILPNGDLLSNHVINWTLSNNHIRTELALALGPDIDLTEARRLISEEILANPNTLHKIAPEILLSGITTSGYDLKVQFWINNIRQEDALKSELLAGIYQRLTTAGIAMR
ncbi:mechanosensitive ion channel [Hymenobacter sp. RP-2-7]|uniref:Mechanosensitive ion channel n=1 Tax=Hymenobacter polaris TaxID=2682546 RepID=A0A7Y0AC52_9BACT|nr:mechanosensitive ion channel domain-containing protein [Hymenobacter polaris]NML64628.1 mechanosensitive ion channel [Hymenobacter polaris]